MDCIDEFLEFYNNKDRTEFSTNLWCTKYLIELVKRPSSKLQMKNCILMMLNLFIKDVPDHYHLKGKSVRELNNVNKKELIGVLKSEFVNN